MPAKRPAARLPLLKEENLTAPQQRAARIAALRATWQVAQRPRPVRRLDACAGIRPAGAGARRPCPLQDRARAATVGIRHPVHGALWKAQYEWFAHAPMAARPASSRRRSTTCARAVCRNRRPRTSARSTISSRNCTRRGASATALISACACTLDDAAISRTRRHPRLLRADLDDTQRLQHDAAGERKARLRRAAVCLSAAGFGLFMR